MASSLLQPSRQCVQSTTDWRFEWHRTWDSVWNEPFVSDWQQLMRRSPYATVFHEPALVRAWAETRGGAVGAKPLFGIASRGDGAMVLLTFVVQDNRGRRVTRRAISAAGDAFFGYHDPLVAGIDPVDVDWAPFWNRVRQETAGDADHALMRFVNATYGRGPFVDALTTPSPVLDLSSCSTLDEVLAKCSRKHRADIGRQKRRLEEEVGSLELWSAGRAESLLAISDFRQHFLTAYARNWSDRERRSMFDDPGVQDFAERVLSDGIPGGWARYSVLRAGGQPLAWLIGLEHRRASYWWVQTYAREVRQYSPGRLAFGFAIADALSRGFTAVHMMTGESTNKLEWRPRRTDLHALRWYAPTVKGALLGWYDRQHRARAGRRSA
jgi:CelD/BcsL family acetyltransferase involved in cellulose biosynthesis